MDQELITRFRQGDDAAKMAIRTHLRAVAARVLAAPQWKLSEATTRSALEIQAAVTALESPAQDPVGFAVAAMQSAAVAGLEHLRALDGAMGAHPEADVMAQVALETAAPGHVVHVERHTETCPTCTAHLVVLRSALTSAATAQRAATPAPPAARPAPDAKPASQPKASAPKKDAARKRPGRRQPKKKQAAGMPWGTLAVVAAGVVVAGWWTSRLTDQEQAWVVASHLPDELPSGSLAATYESGTAEAIRSLGRGDCRSASSKLHMAWKRAPDDWTLRYLEGLSYVCLRDPKALDALQDVNDNMSWDELPWGFDWWYAQALVLDGQVDEALDELDRLAGSDHPRGPDAAQLADSLRAAY